MTPDQEQNAGTANVIVRAATRGILVAVGAKDGLVRLGVGTKGAERVSVVLHAGAALKLAEAILHEARLAQMRSDRTPEAPKGA